MESFCKLCGYQARQTLDATDRCLLELLIRKGQKESPILGEAESATHYCSTGYAAEGRVTKGGRQDTLLFSAVSSRPHGRGPLHIGCIDRLPLLEPHE